MSLRGTENDKKVRLYLYEEGHHKVLGRAASAGDDDAGDQVLSIARERVQNHIPNGWQ